MRETIGRCVPAARWVALATMWSIGCGPPPPVAAPRASTVGPADDGAAATVASVATRRPAVGRASAAPFFCAPGSDEHHDAVATLRAIDTLIARLPAGGDPTPGVEAIDAALTHRCLALAGALQGDPEVDSVLSLQTFWDDGGSAWLWSVLQPYQSEDGPEVVIPPSPRRTLSLERTPDHPLAALLCSEADPTCGVETRGWWSRAAVAVQANHARIPHLLPPSTEDCEDDAIAQVPVARDARERAARFRVWVDCVAARTAVAALPVGATRAPDAGWFVVGGRRGHYEPCAELRAYHLATGAAYVARWCGTLVLAPGGSVNVDATQRSHGMTVTTGRLPADNLREAALMLMLADGWYGGRQSAVSVTLPERVAWSRVEPNCLFPLQFSSTYSSADTTIWWLYAPDGTLDRAISGSATWPSGRYQPFAMHAVELLAVAEEGFVSGCAPATLPRDLPIPVRPLEASTLNATPPTGSELELLVMALRAARGEACR